MSIGRKILIYLKQIDKTQTWLSAETKIPFQQLHAALHDRRKLTIDEFAKIAKALNLDANEFIKSSQPNT